VRLVEVLVLAVSILPLPIVFLMKELRRWRRRGITTFTIECPCGARFEMFFRGSGQELPGTRETLRRFEWHRQGCMEL
jgi:hypothetical protein